MSSRGVSRRRRRQLQPVVWRRAPAARARRVELARDEARRAISTHCSVSSALDRSRAISYSARDALLAVRRDARLVAQPRGQLADDQRRRPASPRRSAGTARRSPRTRSAAARRRSRTRATFRNAASTAGPRPKRTATQHHGEQEQHHDVGQVEVRRAAASRRSVGARAERGRPRVAGQRLQRRLARRRRPRQPGRAAAASRRAAADLDQVEVAARARRAARPSVLRHGHQQRARLSRPARSSTGCARARSSTSAVGQRRCPASIAVVAPSSCGELHASAGCARAAHRGRRCSAGVST